MAGIRVLVDTDILIDYFNRGDHAWLLDHRLNRIYFSVVTERELLAKRGLRDSERQAIQTTLARFRCIRLTPAIAARYASLRAEVRGLERADALVAATALVKRLPLMTRNWKDFRRVAGLTLFTG